MNIIFQPTRDSFVNKKRKHHTIHPTTREYPTILDSREKRYQAGIMHLYDFVLGV